MDLMYVPRTKSGSILSKLYFQRRAKVFIFVGVGRYSGPVSMKGWKSEGYAVRLTNRQVVTYGIYQRGVYELPRIAYVFSRSVTRHTMIPTKQALSKQARKLVTNGMYHVRISEWNGQASPSVGKFRGLSITPNKPCPQALHDMWKISHPDSSDKQTKNRNFATWHPTWDPCFWCAYNHDHGSSPFHLMNYRPIFGYTALKNGDEYEPNEGFKGFVFRKGNYYVYFAVHAQTSRLRRMRERWHTVTLAVTEVKTGKLMAEFTQKGDYGFLSAKSKTRGFIPLSRKDAELATKFREHKEPQRFRSVNVIAGGGKDKKKMDSRFRYRSDPLVGVYESWGTAVMCTGTERFGEMVVDIESPGTAVSSAKDLHHAVMLGVGKLNTGLGRNIRMKNVKIGAKYCQFEGGEKMNGGYFYTDVMGKRLLKGPGKGAVRQFVSKELSLNLFGRYKLGKDRWLGMFENGATGVFLDHGYGIDPRKN